MTAGAGVEAGAGVAARAGFAGATAEETTASPSSGVCCGAYGLQFSGEGELARALADAGPWLLPADPEWPSWRIAWSPAHGAGASGTGELLDRARARLSASAAGGWIELDREARCTLFAMPEPVAPAALVHPYLTSTAAIAAHWFGRTPLHAGGFVVDGRAWGVLGGREMGKSSLLMGLQAAGMVVVSDDLLVVEAGRVFSGPRCLDLREGAAERYGVGRALGRVGRRDRWRVDLPPVPGEMPLAGWILLGWSDAVTIEPVSVPQRLSALAINRAVVARGEALEGLLEAVTYPVFLFSRPRDWSKMNDGLELLVRALAGI